jgi:hypothetical protein
MVNGPTTSCPKKVKEGMMVSGGVVVQKSQQLSGKEKASEVALVILCIVLVILVTGVWACLWVPPSFTF